MIKKYKIVKYWPGGPEIGKIFQIPDPINIPIQGQTNDGIKWEILPKDLENKEYFEEVVELDYEILQMKNSHGNFYSLSKNEVLGKYELENHTIYSIKRLSDGAIFSIGDLITDIDIPIKATIKSISIDPKDPNESKERGIPWFILGDRRGLSMLRAKHYKEPLFKTFDNVEVGINEKWWYVNTNIWYISAEITYKELFNNLDVTHYKYFSTKEAALAYMDENKPMYSKKDIKEAIIRNTYCFIHSGPTLLNADSLIFDLNVDEL